MMVTIIMLKNPNLFWARPLESYKDFCVVKQIKPSFKQTILGISSPISQLIWGLKTRYKPTVLYQNRCI